MQTIKTGIVVALLLAVCYGAFVALNAPEPQLPAELEEWANDGQLDRLMDIEIPTQSGSGGLNTSLSPASNVSFPSVSLPTMSPVAALPEATLPDLPTYDLPRTPGGTVSPPTALVGTTTKSVDYAAMGPAIKLPPSLGSADSGGSTSLVLDAVTKTNPTKSASLAGEYPAIPLVAATEKVLAAPAGNATAAQPPLPPFSVAREQALKQANDGDLKGALVALTAYYNSPELPHSEYTDLLEILDALAREVIYSRRHLVATAYVATAGETIASVASKHHITPELLSSINQLQTANVLIQDQQIKVLDGPFRGEVDLARGELTVFLRDMYAGRFPISVGADPAPRSGHFEVADKLRDRSYYGTGNKVIAADDPKNPYGGYWIDLGHDMCLHGSAEMVTTDLKTAGCISLAPIDAADVYSMLIQGSQIDIRN